MLPWPLVVKALPGLMPVPALRPRVPVFRLAVVLVVQQAPTDWFIQSCKSDDAGVLMPALFCQCLLMH